MEKLKKFMNNPFLIISLFDRLGISKLMPSTLYLRCRYRAAFKKKLNLKKPQTYSEKLQWLKLYDHNPSYVNMVDKYLVKQYVSEKIGSEYVIPTIGVWESVDDIPFEQLPNQYVLKCTHDSGGLVIVKDNKNLDKEKAKAILNKSLKRNYYWVAREWPYKNVKPRIIAEQYMEDTETRELRDYKFFVFDGVAKVVFIASERFNSQKDTAFDFFDMEFNHLDIKNGHPNAMDKIKKPRNFEEMKNLAEKLGKNIPTVRIDFYEVNGKTYFGEITFYNHSGLSPFEPETWDYTLGSWTKLPHR